MHDGLRTERIAEWHREILTSWERDMEFMAQSLRDGPGVAGKADQLGLERHP